ncbi:uncharacterized protein TRIADDRAFT_63930 [Trichoplax adhaerens]|uniref:Uncharacterized protein n=1 Tax=Trichoplax adhaerens TaxID=10228 RepID=B3RXB4_TRIAD|nr:hypothetical protein TRIADDRAFT_63930 [Trichoplax adhaerens]EDV24388.1 hypothetical protein TRIADDRAFT_63930 [Trichoplax adhaerens]|eukprot:XP_002112278.1 hypothetical protein TRIADDRAFT_63930 [Trichoplax adhaerens]
MTVNVDRMVFDVVALVIVTINTNGIIFGIATLLIMTINVDRMITQDLTKSKSKWITDFTLMPQYNKIVTSTGDREIQFYEMSTFEPYCQISGLDSVPLKIDYWGSRSTDECYVLYGDVQGCINVIQIASAGETLRTWKKSPKSDGIASVNLERWKVHNDWVGQLNYYESIQSVISCSNDDTNALVIGSLQSSTKVDSQLREIYYSVNSRHRIQQSNYIMGSQPKRRSDSDQTVFKIYKGVKTFDFSKQKNLIVTGGMDRIIRTWNPYVANKPTGMLRGHNAPINYIKISSDEGRVFSVSTDKTIRIWDLQDHTCLHIVRPKAHKIRGDIQVVHYNTQNRTIAIATDLLASMTLKCKTIVVDMATSHKEAITAIKYNSSFRQIVTASDGSVVRVWDIETGNLLFEFTQAHGTSAITAITFDSSGRRLITAGRDGCLRIWNYNNGHCLRILRKDGRNQEISDITYYTQNKNKHIVSVGWDKRINIYNDNPDDFRYVQPPMPYWTEDTINGHQDDILGIAVCSPNLLATSSYKGRIIVWNLVSGHIFCRLQVPCKDSQYKAGEQNAITKVTFLGTRLNDKFSAILVSNGPNGYIHFWNVYNGGAIYASFKATDFDEIVAIATNHDNSRLFTADAKGFIGTWDIKTYASGGKEYMPPDVLYSWRAHTQTITSMDLIEYQEAIATASTDCTLRLWTYEGKYIGTFGQQESWDIYDPTSYQSPMVPYDVLVDPQSLPNHPILKEKTDIMQVANKNSTVEPEKKKGPNVQVEQSPTQWYKNMKHNSKFDDLDITSEVLRERLTGSGKRLRHEILTPLLRSRSGVTREYQSLPCYDLQDTPSIPEPQKLTSHNDPFDSIFN